MQNWNTSPKWKETSMLCAMAPKAPGKQVICMLKKGSNTHHHPPQDLHFRDPTTGKLPQHSQQTWKSSIHPVTKCITAMTTLLTSPFWMTYCNAPS
jgi:hypothetical protein